MEIAGRETSQMNERNKKHTKGFKYFTESFYYNSIKSCPPFFGEFSAYSKKT